LDGWPLNPLQDAQFCFHRLTQSMNKKVKQSRYKSGQAQRVPRS